MSAMAAAIPLSPARARRHTGRVPRRATRDGARSARSATLRAEQVEATRRAVLDAARAWFGSKGYAQTSVDEIAAAARVTKGAVYHHFAGKEALFRAVWAEVEADAQARALAGRDPDLPPIDQIVAMVHGYLDAALDEEIRRITLIDGPALLGLEPDLPPDQEAVQAEGRAFIAAAIGRGEITDVDPALLLGLIGGLTLQAGLQIARAEDPDATRAALGPAIEAMVRGLAPGG
jgi:AcrR family transcriptional regulator